MRRPMRRLPSIPSIHIFFFSWRDTDSLAGLRVVSHNQPAAVGAEGWVLAAFEDVQEHERGVLLFFPVLCPVALLGRVSGVAATWGGRRNGSADFHFILVRLSCFSVDEGTVG